MVARRSRYTEPYPSFILIGWNMFQVAQTKTQPMPIKTRNSPSVCCDWSYIQPFWPKNQVFSFSGFKISQPMREVAFENERIHYRHAHFHWCCINLHVYVVGTQTTALQVKPIKFTFYVVDKSLSSSALLTL